MGVPINEMIITDVCSLIQFLLRLVRTSKVVSHFRYWGSCSSG